MVDDEWGDDPPASRLSLRSILIREWPYIAMLVLGVFGVALTSYAGSEDLLDNSLRTNKPIRETGKWLAQVVAGYFAYHAVPTNGLALAAFRHHVAILWHQQLCRRSQRARLVWTQMAKLADESSSRRRRSFTRGPACGSPLDTQGRSRVPELGSLGSVRGALRNERPLYVASVRQMIISAGWRGKR